MNFHIFIRRARKSPLFIIGAFILLVIVILCAFAPVFSRYDPGKSVLASRLAKPEWFSDGLNGHILGCDALGRDIWTRILYGGRVSLFVSVTVVAISTVVGVLVGLICGYFSGMDEKTLSTILGHYSVAFTMDTYAHVLDDHLHQEMLLMEDLYHINQIPQQNIAYSVIAGQNGAGYVFQCPDFPEIILSAPSMELGVQAITTAIQDAVATMQFPPAPTPPTVIPLLPGQFLLQIVL